MGVLWEHLQANPPHSPTAKPASRRDRPRHRTGAREAPRPTATRPASSCSKARDGPGRRTPSARPGTRTRPLALLLFTLALALAGAVTAASCSPEETRKPRARFSLVEPTLAPKSTPFSASTPTTNTLVATIGVGRDPGSVATGRRGLGDEQARQHRLPHRPCNGGRHDEMPSRQTPTRHGSARRPAWVLDEHSSAYRSPNPVTRDAG